MTLLEELTTGPLATELIIPIINGDEVLIASVLNRKDIPSKKPIMTHDIYQYLTLVDLLISIEDSPALSCKIATRALSIFDSFDIRNPMILGKLDSVLDGLVAETLIPDFTETNKATILSLGNSLTSRSLISFGRDITELEVRKELWNDNGTRKI